MCQILPCPPHCSRPPAAGPRRTRCHQSQGRAIETSLAGDYPKLDALYKELHAHPELAFQEVKTAARLAAEMRALGFDVTENVGMTGLVAIYKNGDGPTIMVRTELDALPMEEKTGLDYASRDKTNWNGREVFRRP
jgi:hippurate hydrolase